MASTKISAGADPGTVVATDKVPMARSASTTAYAATMAELAVYANTAYVPNYSSATPAMDGTGAAGTAATVSRGDHKHPTDTSVLSLGGGTLTGLLTLSGNPTATMHAATKQYVDGSAPAGGPYVSIANMHDVGRNLIHNPLFNVAQRGVGPFTTASYTLDRWRTWISSDTVSVIQFALSDGARAQIGDEAAAYALVNAFTGNAAAGAYNFLTHAIEDVRRLAGKTITISFWAQSNSGTPKLGINIQQDFGAGGSPSTALRVLSGVSVTVSTTWTRYSTTVAVPSIAGKTLGTNGNHAAWLELWYSSGATNNAIAGNIGVQSGTVQLWGVQLEVGSVATPLDYGGSPQQQLANCQRFYSIVQGYVIGSYAAAATTAYGTSLFPVTMRAVPTITFASSAVANAGALTVNATYTNNVQLRTTVPGAGAFYSIADVIASADL